jgi:ABC-type proline/glycine betaine transport system permease subunit
MPVKLHWFLPTTVDSRTVIPFGPLGHGRPPTIDYLAQIARAADQLGYEAVLTPTGTWCVVPGALPGFFTGLRFAFAVSWLVLVFAEQVNATSGIGYLATNAREFLRSDILVVTLFVYGALGFASDALVRLLERTALQWRPSFNPA